jgi:hypothetical protein
VAAARCRVGLLPLRGHMSFVTTQPEMLAWTTENLQGVHRHPPTAMLDATRPANQPFEGQRIAQSRRGRDTTDRILTTSQLARHSASPRRLPIGEMHEGDRCNS